MSKNVRYEESTPAVVEAFKRWKASNPRYTVSTRSFVAGYNAALADTRQDYTLSFKVWDEMSNTQIQICARQAGVDEMGKAFVKMITCDPKSLGNMSRSMLVRRLMTMGYIGADVSNPECINLKKERS